MGKLNLSMSLISFHSIHFYRSQRNLFPYTKRPRHRRWFLPLLPTCLFPPLNVMSTTFSPWKNSPSSSFSYINFKLHKKIPIIIRALCFIWYRHFQQKNQNLQAPKSLIISFSPRGCCEDELEEKECTACK